MSLDGQQRLLLLAAVLGGIGAVLWLGPLHGVTRPSAIAAIPWWAELLGCYLASLAYVQVRVAKFGSILSLTEIPVAIGLFLVDPHVLLGCYVLGVLAGNITRRGPLLVKDVSNLMLDVVYMGVTVLVFVNLHPNVHDPLAPRSLAALACAMAVTGWGVGPLALNLGLLLQQGWLRRADVIRSIVFQISTTTINTCLGIIGLLLIIDRPLVALALVPPVVLVLLVELSAGESQRRADRMEFLCRTGDILNSTRDVNERAGELLGGLTAMFGVRRAELVLVPEARGSALRFSADDGGTTVLSSDLTHAEQEALNALRASRLLRGGRQGSDAALSLVLAERSASYGTLVALRGVERPQGMLLLLEPLNGRSRPTQQEQNLLLAVAGQISVALENGQLAGAIRTMSAEREELTRRAFYDPLTQIANRSLFIETVARALSRLGSSRRPLAALFIDLDGFKEVNDTHGHAAGDQVLSAVAARLRALIRKFDMVARLGGDEFGILLHGMRRREDAHIVAQRIVDALHSPVSVDSGSVTLGGSVGVAVVDDSASAPAADELLRRADMAMYLAKRQGKDRYVVFDTGAREPVIAMAGTAMVQPVQA